MNEKRNLFLDFRKELLSRQLYNSDKFDNAILTLSTGVLAISVTFIKDIVSFDKALGTPLLIISWILFGLAILSTMSSFLISQAGINTQLKYAKKYYIDEDDNFLNKKNKWANATNIINTIAGVFFGVAIALTITFVSLNLKIQKGDNMTENKNGKAKETKGAVIPAMVPSSYQINDGAPVPAMVPDVVSSIESTSTTDAAPVPAPSNNDSSETDK